MDRKLMKRAFWEKYGITGNMSNTGLMDDAIDFVCDVHESKIIILKVKE